MEARGIVVTDHVEWKDNDELFKSELKAGYKWQVRVGEFLESKGFRVEIPELEIRESIKEAGKFRDSKDLIVEGYRIEVKSRGLYFRSAEDFPFDPVFIDTKSKWDSHGTHPVAYVFVSQETGAMACIDGRSNRLWTVKEKFDNVRNIREEFYCAEKRLLMPMQDLVYFLRDELDMTQLTKKDIQSLRSSFSGEWNHLQLRLIRVKIPLVTGWIDRAVGRWIPRAHLDKAKSLRGATKSQKKHEQQQKDLMRL